MLGGVLENGKGVATDAGSRLHVHGCLQVTSLYRMSHAPLDVILTNTCDHELRPTSPKSADMAYPGEGDTKTTEGPGGSPHAPFRFDTTVPKDDRIWANMYCVFMFDRQIFSEHRHERFIRGPTSGQYPR